MTIPERDNMQDSKSALAFADVICQNIKEEKSLSDVKKLCIVSDNAGTYASYAFHIAVFDVICSHCFEPEHIAHKESQDGNSEIDPNFLVFKQKN